MVATIPRGVVPVYSAQPHKAPMPLIHAELRDVVVNRSDLPRGFGSQLAGWQGGVR